jgi:putative membrane protein
MVCALGVLLLLVQIRQPFPNVAPLHHVPTVVLLLSAPFLLRRWPLSTASVACILVFFALHTIGGRYTYTNMPYDRWVAALIGHGISETFGFDRNHYDRLVHFSYGLLAVRPTWELLRRHFGAGPSLALYIAVECVLAVSALYELFEWLIAILLAGPMADDYNGQQGDIWDAQKDMGLALLGALIAAITLKLKGSRHA